MQVRPRLRLRASRRWPGSSEGFRTLCETVASITVKHPFHRSRCFEAIIVSTAIAFSLSFLLIALGIKPFPMPEYVCQMSCQNVLRIICRLSMLLKSESVDRSKVTRRSCDVERIAVQHAITGSTEKRRSFSAA